MKRLLWGLFLVVSIVPWMVGFCQGTQTASATLETVISVIEDNRYVPQKHVEILIALVTVAVEGGKVTPEQALAMLKVVGWGEPGTEVHGFPVRALELAFVSLTASDNTYEDILGALEEAVALRKLSPLMPAGSREMAVIGVLDALVGSGEELSSSIVGKIEQAIASGIPPGLIVETVKHLSREGATEEEILEALDELISGDTSGHHGKGGGAKEEGKCGKGEKKGGKGGTSGNPGKGGGNGHGSGHGHG